jgi:hypothetical protein
VRSAGLAALALFYAAALAALFHSAAWSAFRTAALAAFFHTAAWSAFRTAALAAFLLLSVLLPIGHVVLLSGVGAPVVSWGGNPKTTG